jgi:hypothetical protein
MSESIRVVRAPDGALAYAVAMPPERLPPVLPRDLLRAWEVARDAAGARLWGPPRTLLFRRHAGETTEIAIADRDARCWAEAIDRAVGLESVPGLALCLRLLALVEVMTRATWLVGLFDVTRTGTDLHPALLRAAAVMPLDAGARFDETGLRSLLSRPLPAGVPA